MGKSVQKLSRVWTNQGMGAEHPITGEDTQEEWERIIADSVICLSQ